MMKTLQSLLASVILLAYSQLAFSSQYLIELKPDDNDISDYVDVLSIYGEVYTVKENDERAFIQLGPFDSQQNAIDVLHEIRVAGFDNAVIIKNDDKRISDSAKKSRQYRITDYDVSKLLNGNSLTQWNQLSVTEQANIEYHAGVLKIKNGDTLTPFDEYIASKR